LTYWLGGLTPLLAPRTLPLRSGAEGETVESEVAWSLKFSDFRMDSAVGGLDEQNTLLDMERMGVSVY
jgi:hypothetical protein